MNPLSSKAIYKSLGSCYAIYIKLTGQSLDTRLSYHQYCTRTHLLKKSAAAKDQHHIGHQILFDGTLILIRCHYFVNYKISKYSKIVKRETRYHLPSVWNAVIQFRSIASSPVTGLTESETYKCGTLRWLRKWTDSVSYHTTITSFSLLKDFPIALTWITWNDSLRKTVTLIWRNMLNSTFFNDKKIVCPKTTSRQVPKNLSQERKSQTFLLL